MGGDEGNVACCVYFEKSSPHIEIALAGGAILYDTSNVPNHFPVTALETKPNNGLRIKKKKVRHPHQSAGPCRSHQTYCRLDMIIRSAVHLYIRIFAPKRLMRGQLFFRPVILSVFRRFSDGIAPRRVEER